jgi:hypothetical protein
MKIDRYFLDLEISSVVSNTTTKIPLNASKEEEEEGDDVEDLLRRGTRKFSNVKLGLLKSLGNQLDMA